MVVIRHSPGCGRVEEPLARIVVRPIASPLTLGFLALAVSTFTMAGVELHWIPASQDSYAGLAVLVFAVPLQFLSCIYGFLARDSIAGTGMGLLSGSWLVVGLLTFLGHFGKPAPALGLLLLGSATAILVPAIVGAASKPLATLVMTGAALRFWLTAAYEMRGGAAWKYAAAAEGLVLAGVALYAALAFELEDNRKHTVLPTLRRREARQAMSGSVSDEVAQVHHEAGVRKQL
jgi:uncharacterized protein